VVESQKVLDGNLIPELVAFALVVLGTAAEQLHARRCRRVAALAFGPREKPAPWARLAPFLRVGSLGALGWGLTTLLILPPKTHKVGVIPENEYRHLVLVLDVSPSMRLTDAGPERKQSRSQRASALLKSFFERVPIERYRTSVIATYTDAKPVVVNTTDLEIVRNILSDLPMHHAFKSGATNLFAGLEQAAKIAQPWKPRSTTVMVISDGDTVPATGLPKMPASVGHVVLIGVGDPQAGQFIDGHHSRQDASTLRSLAARLGGTYHNGNEKHLSSDLLRQITAVPGKSPFERLTRREYALFASGIGSTVLALLPIALYFFGTRWRPGVRVRKFEPSVEDRKTRPREVVTLGNR
jgi:Ca-activated chloride channel family protein